MGVSVGARGSHSGTRVRPIARTPPRSGYDTASERLGRKLGSVRFVCEPRETKHGGRVTERASVGFSFVDGCFSSCVFLVILAGTSNLF